MVSRIGARQRQSERSRELARVHARTTFRAYAESYLAPSKAHKVSWRTDESRLDLLAAHFGDKFLDEITPLEIEQLRDSLLESRTKATANRYRDLLSVLFKRAVRDGHVATNPVRTVSKFKETGGRMVYRTNEEESAILDRSPRQCVPFFGSQSTPVSEQIEVAPAEPDLLAPPPKRPSGRLGRTRAVSTTTPGTATATPSPAAWLWLGWTRGLSRSRADDGRYRWFSGMPTLPHNIFRGGGRAPRPLHGTARERPGEGR